jgi:hypothetical protein
MDLENSFVFRELYSGSLRGMFRKDNFENLVENDVCKLLEMSNLSSSFYIIKINHEGFRRVDINYDFRDAGFGILYSQNDEINHCRIIIGSKGIPKSSNLVFDLMKEVIALDRRRN